jgi:energy-coupling factor transporter ATP-binding protein EcfA2
MNDTTSKGVRPVAPRSLDETGLNYQEVVDLACKTFYMQKLETASEISSAMKLGLAISNNLLESMKDANLLENLGVKGADLSAELRFTLTHLGRERALDAFAKSQYTGPAPVTLEHWVGQVRRQAIKNEQIDQQNLIDALEGLVVPSTLVRRLGPAINSERSLLLYGAPGNGKTTLAEVIGGIFTQHIYVPHCVTVDGTIIKLFDPTLHLPLEEGWQSGEGSVASLRLDDTDRRWVKCRRPVIITGGELTIDMLDLRYNPNARFYEAPLHMKAIGGTFVVDDLGRQLVRPEDLLNRWITPMEKRFDFLTLNTGKTFEIPFDELLIFSTNLLPEDIMDPAFLRRIPYKVEVKKPGEEEFTTLFNMLCERAQLKSSPQIVRFIMDKLTQTFEQPLSYYQPKFIVDQIHATCKYLSRPLTLDEDILVDALENLSARSEEGMIRRQREEMDPSRPGQHIVS